ncbi:MAG: hypothetical protein PW791_16155 [Neorhizobium sp.]|nr:hypothetical protein [Neorhizobium sp.]
MKKIIAMVAMAAATLLSTIAVEVPAANAQGIELRIDDGRGPPRYDDDRRGPPPRWDDRRGPPRMRGCSPDRALDVADRYGVRRARIADMSPRRVVVVGIGRRGERTQLVLSNDPSCRRLN